MQGYPVTSPAPLAAPDLFHLRTNLRYGCTILRHNLGIASIDSQHRGLMDMVNELVDVVECGCDCEVARQHMANIIRFTEEHFAHEEDLMHRHNFPGREKHAAEHREVLSQAVTMTEAL